MGSPGEVQRGVALALEAQRRGFLDEEALSLVFAYDHNLRAFIQQTLGRPSRY